MQRKKITGTTKINTQAYFIWIMLSEALSTLFQNVPILAILFSLLTGDHRMPEIPMSTKIDRYHVPLIIYSPLLKQNKHFASVSSHLDITPSLISFLSHQYHFPMPSEATWLGSGLDTATAFRNIHAYPLMQTKNEINDFVMDDYLLKGNDLYKMSDNMNLDPIDNDAEKKRLQAAFKIFRQKNNMLINGALLQPNH